MNEFQYSQADLKTAINQVPGAFFFVNLNIQS
jgi:hypothetical protein